MPANNTFSLLDLRFGSNSLITRKIGQIDIFEDLNEGTPSGFHKKNVISIRQKPIICKMFFLNTPIIYPSEKSKPKSDRELTKKNNQK